MNKFLLPLRNILLVLIALGGFCYLLLYVFLPFALNSKDYSGLIAEEFKKNCALELRIKGYKVAVSPSLNITLKAQKVEIYYPSKIQVLDMKDVDLDFSTLALLKKEFRLQKITCSKLQISTKLLKNGKFSIQDYLEKHYKPDENSMLKFSDKLPQVVFDEVLVKVKDEASAKKFKICAKNFKIAKGKLSNLDLISAAGGLYYFDDKYFDYNLKLSVDDKFFRNLKIKPIHISVDNFEKHRPRGVLDVNLKILSQGKNEISGHVNIDKFTFIADKKRLPSSYFHILIDKNTAVLQSEFYASKNEKALISSKFNINPLNKIYLKCSTKMIHLANLQPILIALADIFCIPNNLDEFSASGYAIADFELETDFKKIKSSGNLKISDARIKHKNLPFNISSIQADIDFANNNVLVNSSRMLINNQLAKLSGKIDSDANCDLILIADKLNLANIMNAFEFLRPYKDLKVLSGTFSMNAIVKGSLNSVKPNIEILITKFVAAHDKSSSKFYIDQIESKIKNASVEKYDGTLSVKNIRIQNKAFPDSINADKLEAIFNEKNINILPAKIVYDKASVTLSGSVNDYLKPSLNASLRLFGTVDTRVLHAFIPDSVSVCSKGVLPLGMQITFKNRTLQLESNILASKEAYFAPFLMKELGNSVFHLNLKIVDNLVKFEDTGLYLPPASIKLSDKLKTSSLKKIISISGSIDSGRLNLTLSVPEFVKISFEPVKNASLKGELRLTKNIESPELQGVLHICELYASNLYVKNIDLRLEKKFVKLFFSNVKIGNSLLNLYADTGIDLFKTKSLDNLTVVAENIDIEDLIRLSLILPQAKYAPGSAPFFDVKRGKVNVKNLKLNRIKLSNLSSDLRLRGNILSFDNVRANAYGGNVAANLTYNLAYLSTVAKIQARGLDAALAAVAIFPLDSQISGKLDFDSDISMSGVSEAQQLKTMRGTADILVSKALLGPLGQFEHFLHAQNLLSQKVIYASLNSAKRAIAPKNTGYVDYLKGRLKFDNGYIRFTPLLSSGPQMSMYVSGNVNMLTQIVDLEILGKVSPDVSDSIGPLGDLTLKNLLDEHTNYGSTIEKLFNSCNTELPQMDISKIPPLSSGAGDAKNFRVLINGEPQSIKSIKSFTWVNPLGSVKKINESAGFDSKLQNVNPQPASQNKVNTSSPAQSKVPATVIPEANSSSAPSGNSFLDSIPDDFN